MQTDAQARAAAVGLRVGADQHPGKANGDKTEERFHPWQPTPARGAQG